MKAYTAIPVEEDQGCEGCCFYKKMDGLVYPTCKRPDIVPHCLQTTPSGEVIEYIYEVKS